MMPSAARYYFAVVIAIALGVIAYLPWSSTRSTLYALLILSVLMAVVERFSQIKASHNTTTSVSLVVSLASMLILPPSGAAVVGAVSALARPRAPSTVKTVFNAAMFGVVLAAGSEVYLTLGGHDGREALRFPSVFLPYFSAVAVCWILNDFLVIGAISLTTGARFWTIARDDVFRMAMPYFSSSALSLIVTALWDDKSFGVITALLIIIPMYVAHWVLSQQSREQAAYESTINALVQAVEIKDHYTRGHSERVAKGSELIARRMEFPEARISKLRYAGLLHDIGKLSVPTRLLEKTGKLTDDEYREIQLHPNHGVAVIRDITFLTEVYEAVLYHHERLDGRGYPQGRRGDEIPEFARIIGVADAFDAMTSTRSYRAARPVSEALAELWRGAGTQFDPEIVRAFDQALGLLEQAGHPWQISDTPVEAFSGALDARTPSPQPEYTFGDHDDPAVSAQWISGDLGEPSPAPAAGSAPVSDEALEPGRLHSGPNLLNTSPDNTPTSFEDSYPRIGAGPYQIRQRADSPEAWRGPPPLDRRLDERGHPVDAPSAAAPFSAASFPHPPAPFPPRPAAPFPAPSFPAPSPSFPAPSFAFGGYGDVSASDQCPDAGADEGADDDGPDAEVIPLRRRSAPAPTAPLRRAAAAQHDPAPSSRPLSASPYTPGHQLRSPEPSTSPIPHQVRSDQDDPTVEMPRVQNTGSAE